MRLNIGFRHIVFVLPFIHVLLGYLTQTVNGGVSSSPRRWRSRPRARTETEEGNPPHERSRSNAPSKTLPSSAPSKFLNLRRLVPLVLLVWYCLANLSITPHHLAYFNELAGGPKGGMNWLVDSNLDWGQDLKGLKTYVENERVDHLKLLYFGTAEPSYYGIQFEPLTLRDLELWGRPSSMRAPGRANCEVTLRNMQTRSGR
ncbi:MAG: hypothetical protein JSW03_07905 [Candidatus Eiseniibacteriota bacterium]|nr:MAG: hypothetical protein JSW03_07905 [Candidatus Eisenbacteria bacterium]